MRFLASLSCVLAPLVAASARDAVNSKETADVNTVNFAAETQPAPWEARQAPSAIVFQNAIHLMGGVNTYHFFNDIWKSDGETWTQVTAKAPWTERAAAAVAVLKGRLYLMGGSSRAPFLNDVWSYDGTNWVQETKNAPWRGRKGHGAGTLGDKLYMFGGQTGGAQDANDVWSFDGQTWTQLADAPWGQRSSFATTVTGGHPAMIALFGGYGARAAKLDDYWTFDGTSWVEIKKAGGKPWPNARAQHAVVEHAGTVVLFGGSGSGSRTYDDVWLATGNAWAQEEEHAAWPERYGHAAVTFRDEVYMFAGVSGGRYMNDFWKRTEGGWQAINTMTPRSKIDAYI